MKLDNKTYFKGYLISENQIQNLKDNQTFHIGNHYLYYSNDLKFTHYKTEYDEIVILGYCFDTHCIEDTEEDIAKKLVQMIKNKENFHEMINRINGRYVLIVKDESGVIIYPDATTMRPIFYHDNFPVIASHSYLVKEAVEKQYEVTVKNRNYTVNGFLDFSKFENIYKLNPNNYRNLNQGSNVRFFPSEDYCQKNVEQLIEESEGVIKNEIEWVKKQPDIFMTLTGGIDSRVTLSFLHDRMIPMLTYMTENKGMTAYAKTTYANDYKIVNTIADDLNLNHEFRTINSSEVPKEYNTVFRGQMESGHSIGLSYMFATSPEYHNKLHVKSTIYELSKLAFRMELYKSNKIEDYLTAMNNNIPKHLIKDQAFKNDALKGYLDRNHLSYASSKGYYLMDLFYQEQRMGNWHSNITSETDNTMEVFVFMNTREMINILTSQSLNDRKDFTLFKEWIAKYWGVLNYYPINKSKDLYTEFKNQVEEQKYFKTTEEIKLEFKHLKREGKYILPIGPIKKNKTYIVNISNEQPQEKVVLIKTYYSNPAGKNKIFFEIEGKRFDFLELNNGIQLTLGPRNKSNIAISYTKDYDKESWRKAGRISIELVGE